MIDPADKQTAALPLEQKRGRGRPSTGKALSAAEKQRRYRERKAVQVQEVQTDAGGYKRAYEKAEETIAELKAALVKAEGKVLALEERKINSVTGIELTREETTAIVCMLQDKSRDISVRVLSGGPVTPDELKSAEWLRSLARKVCYAEDQGNN